MHIKQADLSPGAEAGVISLVRSKLVSGYTLVFMILLGAVLIRSYHLTVPLVDHMPRQHWTAMMARNFYQTDANIFRPLLDSGGMKEGILYLAEFPLYAYLVSLIYRITGQADMIGRLLSLVGFVITAWFFWLIVRREVDDEAAAAALVFFALAPLSIYMSRVFMRHMTVFAFLMIATYYYINWLEWDEWRSWGLTAIFGALASLMDVTVLYMLLPCGYLAVRKHRRRVLTQGKLWLLVLTMVLPVTGWMVYANIATEYPYKIYTVGFILPPDQLGKGVINSMTLWLSRSAAKTIGMMVVNFVATPLGFAFFVVGLLLAPKKNYFFHLWLLAASATFVIDPEHMFVHLHDYKYIHFVPVVCVFAGRGLSFFMKTPAIQSTIFKRTNPALFYGAVYCVVLVLSLAIIRPFYRLSLSIYRSGQMVQQVTHPEDRIVAVAPGYGLMYYAQRKGWKLDPQFQPLEVNLELIEQWRAEGARYAVAAGKEFLSTYRGLFTALKKRYPIIRSNEEVLILDIKTNKKGTWHSDGAEELV